MEGDAGTSQLDPTPPPGVADTDPRLRRWTLVLFAASALLAVGGGLALWGDVRTAKAERAEATALTAAKECVAATQAPDAKAMKESAAKIIECSTGDFGTQAKLYSGILVDAYKTADAQVEVSDMRAAVERHNPDGTMDILVAMRVKLTNTEKQGEEQGYRLRVQMAPEDGTYKVARMDQVSQ